MKTLQALLDSEVADVIGPGHRCRTFPAIFEYSDTVSTVLERLGANESVEEQLYGLVLRKSAPTPPAQSSASRETWSRGPVIIKDVLGFIDLSIILQTALRRIFEGNVVHYEADQLEGLAAKFSSEAVGTLLDGGSAAYHGAMTTDWALKGAESSRLQELIRACFLLIKPGGSMRPPRSPAKSIHHVALYTLKGDDESSAELTGVLSQTDIIRALHDYEATETLQGSTVFHKTVRELGLVGLCATDVPPSPSTTSSETSERHCLAAPGSRITLVPSSVSTLEAFRRMCMHRDSGVGMLAPDGTLKNHLCATDLQCLAPGSFHKLLMPVDAFLEQRPLMEDKNTESAVAESAEERPAKRARTMPCRKVSTCQATSTLAEVVSIMASHDAHQVYVVDPDSKPLSSITIIDTLRVILDSVSKSEVHVRSGTPATPQEILQEVAVRTSGVLESATSCQSDRGISVCTSDLSTPQHEIATVEIQAFSSAATTEASKLRYCGDDQAPTQPAE